MEVPPGDVPAVGAMFAAYLPRLRAHARPVYVQLGILPETAAGLSSTTELAPVSPG